MLQDLLYKETFILAEDVPTTGPGELFGFGTLEGLLDHLNGKSVQQASDLRILHGALAPGKNIPRAIKGQTPFIILASKKMYRGIVVDSESEDWVSLADEIVELLIKHNEDFRSQPYDIEETYILFGYELSLTSHINEEDINGTMLSKCISLVESQKPIGLRETMVNKTVIQTTINGVPIAGRFLGFLKGDDQFNAVVNSTKLCGKILTMETKDFLETCRRTDNVSDMRIVMAGREKSGETVTGKTLFILPKMEVLTTVAATYAEISLEGGKEVKIEEKDA